MTDYKELMTEYKELIVHCEEWLEITKRLGIYCTKCDVTTSKTWYKLKVQLNSAGQIDITEDERDKAIEAWNRRANE